MTKKENITLTFEIASNITKLVLREDLDIINQELDRLYSNTENGIFTNTEDIEYYLDLRQSVTTLLTKWYGEIL